MPIKIKIKKVKIAFCKECGTYTIHYWNKLEGWYCQRCP